MFPLTNVKFLKYDTIITPGNEDFLHHWVLNECDNSFETEFLNKNGVPQAGPCYSFHPSQKDGQWSQVMKYCTKVSLVWAVGSPLVSLMSNF